MAVIMEKGRLIDRIAIFQKRIHLAKRDVLVCLAIFFFSLSFLSSRIVSRLTFSQNETVKAGSSSSTAQIGQKAPLFSLLDFTGTNVALSSYQGKPVVILFWSSGCSSCFENMKQLEQVYQQLKDQVVFLAIHRSTQESKKRAALIVQKFAFSYPLLTDTDGSVYNQYKFNEFMPITYIIDKNGVVAERLTGLFSADTIKGKLRQLIGQ